MKILLALVLILVSGCAHAPVNEWTPWCGYEAPIYGDDC